MKILVKHIVLAITVSVAAACSTDGTLDPSDRPEPPPVTTLDADLSFFEERTPEPGGETSSWAQAMQTVAAAQAQLELLELPSQLFAAALAGQGVRDGDEWRWPFSVTIDGEPYDGELRGGILGDNYDWNLYVTAPAHSPPLSDYIIARGLVAPGGYEGLWWLADIEAGTDTVTAAVSWVRNLENSINFTFSRSDTTSWDFQPSSNGHILTEYVYTQPRRRVSWYPDGSGRSWTSATSTSCWDEDLHDTQC